MSVRLTFCDQTVAGQGSDVDGAFVMEGDCFANGSRVMVAKRYEHLTVQYDGKWDGQLIAGHWWFKIVRVSEEGVVHREERGSFELWPLSHEQSLGYRFEPRALPEHGSETSAPGEEPEQPQP